MAQAGVPPGFGDRGWEQLWERTLDQVDRHRYGLHVWRGELPDDPLGRRVVPELARRWRRRAAVYAAGWLAFALFWLGVATAAVDASGAPTTLVPWSCTATGMVVVGACLAARRRFARTLARARG